MLKYLHSNKDPMMNTFKNTFIILPTPMNISSWWNFGSILALILIIQIISGMILSMHYIPQTSMAFDSIIHIMQNIKGGWYIRTIHMNGASLFFICMYLHIWRGLYYHSYNFKHVWLLGVIILLLSMTTAFMGYVLPWGQMSYWGATVITNLLTAIPYFGNFLIYWIWGDYSISTPTLGRFFSLHYLFPLIITMLVIIHLAYLHMYGSNNPNGISSNPGKISFHPYFTWMDLMGFSWILTIFFIITLYTPYIFCDPDNFIPASQMNTPKHIQPEWYFLFAYAILRSIPNKLGGVIGLMFSILILMILPFNGLTKFKTNKFYPINQFYFWMFLSTCIILTWTGSKPIEYPYMFITQINTIIYFSFFIIFPMINKLWDKIIFMKN